MDRYERIKTLGIISWSWVGIIILLSFGLYILYSIHTVLMPFIYAAVFVYILRPSVNILENKGVPRLLALIISYLGLLAIFILFVAYVGPILYREGTSLGDKLPEYLRVSRGYINTFIEQHPYLRGDQAAGFLTGIENSFTTFLRNAVLAVPSYTADFFGSILNFILAPIIAFYILKDYQAIKTTLHNMIPEHNRAEGMDIVNKMDCVVGGFLKGQALVAISVGALSGIALYVLKVDYAILLGVIIGVFNLIPYLGPIIGGAPAVLIALGTSWQLALIVVVVLVVVQQIDSMLISPRIMSSQVNLHPAVVIFAILVGGTLMGFLGMLLAIPLAAVCKALYLHFKERNEKLKQTIKPAKA